MGWFYWTLLYYIGLWCVVYSAELLLLHNTTSTVLYASIILCTTYMPCIFAGRNHRCIRHSISPMDAKHDKAIGTEQKNAEKRYQDLAGKISGSWDSISEGRVGTKDRHLLTSSKRYCTKYYHRVLTTLFVLVFILHAEISDVRYSMSQMDAKHHKAIDSEQNKH